MKLPNFIIVGAPKCGTTSLYYYLKQHNDIYMPERKELHYFTYNYMKNMVAGPGDRQILSSLCSTREAYEGYYEKVKFEKAVGEVSPSYFYFPDIGERIIRELGRVKIIFMLRDPIEKAFSQYMHLVRDNRETKKFSDALRVEKKRIKEGRAVIWRYAESSLYADKLQKYMEIFGEQNIKVILFDDLKSSPAAVMRDAFRFLEVDDSFQPKTSVIYNRSGRPRLRIVADLISKTNPILTRAQSIIPPKIRTPIRLKLLEFNTGKKDEIDDESSMYLRAYFESDVEKLGEVIGARPKWLN